MKAPKYTQEGAPGAKLRRNKNKFRIHAKEYDIQNTKQSSNNKKNSEKIEGVHLVRHKSIVIPGY